MKKGKISSAALRSSRRLSVAAKSSSEDADRAVRGAQTLAELRLRLTERVAEARLVLDLATDFSGTKFYARLWQRKAALEWVLELLANIKPEGSGAANGKVSDSGRERA